MPSITSRVPNFTGKILQAKITLDTNEERPVSLRILNKLGSGGFATVYRAIDLATASAPQPTYYAVKCTAPARDPLRATAFSRRLDAECALHAHVSDHPHVIGFRGRTFDSALGVHFLILDFAPGGDLLDFLCTGRLWLQDEAVRTIFAQIIDAIIYSHARGVYHRDLKPENILVSDGGRHIYISDFGLSTCLQSSKQFGCGSAAYMSPECHNIDGSHRPYSSPANDVWALGLVLINLLTTCTPWKRANAKDKNFNELLDYEHSDYFLNAFPISPAVNRLLYRIFTPEEERITAIDLRAAIWDIDTFFMSPEQLRNAATPARNVAMDCIKRTLRNGVANNIYRLQASLRDSRSADIADYYCASEDQPPPQAVRVATHRFPIDDTSSSPVSQSPSSADIVCYHSPQSSANPQQPPRSQSPSIEAHSSPITPSVRPVVDTTPKISKLALPIGLNGWTSLAALFRTRARASQT